MQLNVSTCYAMQIMVYLTRNSRIVPSAELSDNLRISQRYILQLTGKLRDGGLIITHTGVNGGNHLAKNPSDISAFDVTKLMEGDLSVPACLTRIPDCGEPCKQFNLHDTVSTVMDYVDVYLKTVTFDKLADMNITGHLSDIISLAETHIDAMKQMGQ